ncbi:MAG: helix-turn-helix transcriptional regulator [Clostridia bacterium]|nr:helix-turn-helix transcriptional regulator [Clostridia bacterium]
MKAYYEVSRERIQAISVHRNVNHTYRPHFHSHVEILVVKKGSFDIQHNGNEYHVGDGQIAFFSRYDIHSYKDENTDKKDDAVIIIPAKNSDWFFADKKDYQVENPLITDANLVNQILEIADRVLLSDCSNLVSDAGVRLILSLLADKISFVKSERKVSQNLIKEILQTIDENFREDISLPWIAKKLGYTEAHVSRTFHQYIRQSINEYLNDIRIAFIKEQLEIGSTDSITELIYKSGFKSVQTYYRNLKRYKSQI